MIPLSQDTFLQEVVKALEIPFETKREMNEEEQEALYATAFDLYSLAKYSEAQSLFTILLFSNPYDPRFWRGLASSRQMLQKYKEALHAWCFVALLDDTDPLAHYHAAECMISSGDTKEALKALALAENIAGGKNAALQAKIQALKDVHEEILHG